MRFQEKSLQDASFLHDQERRKTPTYPPFSEQGFDKVKSLFGRRKESRGRGEETFLKKTPAPPPIHLHSPTFHKILSISLALPRRMASAHRAMSSIQSTLVRTAGIDDGDVILLTCREMLGQIATDGLNDSGGVAFPPGGETGGHFERLADTAGLGRALRASGKHCGS